ncbi:hypothetical protein DVH05_023695 [Phytophthora capsici]|nr:hypothetical protein DVH05_023695 [Phytophthora capsici]
MVPSNGHNSILGMEPSCGWPAAIYSGDDEERINQLTLRHHTTVMVGEVCHRDELSVEVITASMDVGVEREAVD